VLVHNVIQQATQTDILNIQPRQTSKKQYSQRFAQKVFVGPHFWTTNHYLNKVTESGVLHAHPLLCLLFCFILFLLASFYQKHKKISFLLVAFICLLLVLLE
jgi:hypothetical protein